MQNKYSFTIDTNSVKDDGKGVVTFSNGLTITDDGEQRNGTKYDIKSMDLTEYDGKLTANHSFDIQEVIGRTFGLKKGRNRVTIDGIKFAVNESALAGFAYNMLKSGFLTDFSIETYGPFPDDDGVYNDSRLIGLSLVVTGNNKSASINEIDKIAVNSVKHSQELGLDTKLVEDLYLRHNHNPSNMNFVTIKNTRDFPVEVTYKNASDEEVTKKLEPNESVDVSEEQEDVLETQISGAAAPIKEPVPTDNSMEKMLTRMSDEMNKKLAAIEQRVFDNSVEEPKFNKAASANKVQNQYSDMGYRERHGQQILNAWDALKGHNEEARARLKSLNEYNLEQLKKEGIITNAITIADMGNFVISPELLRDIEGFRSNFSGLLARFPFRETLSLQFSWLKRNGDISMTEVEMCDDGADGNLKPISEYDATINTSNLHELAAVTPVCNAATRFLAADLLPDIAQGYRTEYERKLSQLIIARLQQAVNATGNKTPYNGTSNTTTLQSWVNMVYDLVEEVPNGIFIFNYKTAGEFLNRVIAAGISGPLATKVMSGDWSPVLGTDAVVVPNELMPSLNSAETKSFTVEGTAVTINQAVFYVDPAIFSGRTSGGLMYDLSTEAAYEVSSVVKSAFQRNELVLRGSFFRGGAVRDTALVQSMYAAGVS